MAITYCLRCDAKYLVGDGRCPACDTPDYFADPDPVVLGHAVTCLVEKVRAEEGHKRRAKLRDIDRMRPRRWRQAVLRFLRLGRRP